MACEPSSHNERQANGAKRNQTENQRRSDGAAPRAPSSLSSCSPLNYFSFTNRLTNWRLLRAHPTGLPLLGGEGRGEGERFHQLHCYGFSLLSPSTLNFQ